MRWSPILMSVLVMAVLCTTLAQVPGDVNCDGGMTGDDLPALVNVLFGDASSACGASDVNGDGDSTAADLVALLRILDPPPGPVITFFGLAGADGKPTNPLGTQNGTPVFFRNSGSGFQLVLEARVGRSNQPPGVLTFNSDAGDPSRRPDIQIESSAPLGDGSRAICDGGVPAISPPDFGPAQSVANAFNDFACHFPAAATSPNFSCTQDAFGRARFMDSATQTQFCLLVPRTVEFPAGETVLSMRWRDIAGNLGPMQQLILRVGTGPMPPTFTASPTAFPTRTATPSPTSTTQPTATPSLTRSPTRTRTPTLSSVTATSTVSPTSTGRSSPSSTPTATPTRTNTHPPTSATATSTPSPTASATRTGTVLRTGTPSATSTRTRTPTAQTTATASIIPSRTPTVTRTGTPVPTPTRTATRTRTPTPTRTATATPMGPIGPAITFFGVTRADDTPVPPSGTTADNVPIYARPTGAAFSIVIEGAPGAAGEPVGRSAFPGDWTSFADLQIEVSRPLGNGSATVCDRSGPTPGGVPATDPPSFDDTQANIAASNDLSCRFVNGGDMPVARTRDEACVLFPSGDFRFVSLASSVQFCGFVTRFMEFPQGDTLVTARLRDQAGNPGAPMQIVIRIGS